MNESLDPKVRVVRIKVPAPPATRPRRSRRRSLSGVLVEIEGPDLSQQVWVADALDLNADGMGLVLPPALPISTPVLLTFRLDEVHEFSRVPAVVHHREPLAGNGGVRFGDWSDADRLRLLEHLSFC